MPALEGEPPRAVLFDYGNTLVEYSARQLAAVDEALGNALEERHRRVDRAALARIHARQRKALYRPPFVEIALDRLVSALVAELTGETPDAALLDELMAERRRAFDASLTLPPHVPEVLEQLRSRHRLALVSNYGCADCIRASLERFGLTPLFESVVVSIEVGRLKPHPWPFAAALKELELTPEECLFVGDNWLGDVQGAKQLGMRAVHTVEYEGHERFEPGPDDLPADATIAHLSELTALLGLAP